MRYGVQGAEGQYQPWEILNGRTDSICRRFQEVGEEAPLAGYSLFVVQHVLEDLYHLIRAFIDLGCAPDDINVVGIPYSSISEVGDKIRSELQCQVDLPAIFPFDGCIYASFLDALERCQAKGHKLIILEDGGYTVPLVSQLAAINRLDARIIAGAVEQTSRGKWVDEQLDWGGYLRIPVVSIPDCHTKREAEPPYIAWAVQRNLQALLRDANLDRQVRTVGIYGYGTIGAKLASHFKEEQRADVYVNELDPDRALLARQNAFPELTPELLSSCDLIVGTTGATSIGLHVLDKVKHDAILVSTSSRQVEIDVRALSGRAKTERTLGSPGPSVMRIPAGRQFNYISGRQSKSVFVLYDGYPVNFSGESLPDHVGDAVLSLLLEGVAAIAEGRLNAPVIHPGNELLQEQDQDIFDYWRVIKPNDGL